MTPLSGLACLWRTGICLLTLTLSACISPVQHAQHLAKEGGLQPLILEGEGFRHTAYARVTDGDSLLTLFIEGDGRPWIEDPRTPWIHANTKIAADPTPHTPVMLTLAGRTSGSVLYLGRPCYFDTVTDPGCDERWWTDARYAREVVASMTAAAEHFRKSHHLGRILLVGHSGGGTLAVLMAPHLPELAGLVSFAGNLDPEEWTRQHGYLPLTHSLNPAREPALDPRLPQWYVLGGQDTVVTESMAARYLERVPPKSVLRYPRLTHTCCWPKIWQEVHARVLETLPLITPAPSSRARPSQSHSASRAAPE